MKRSAPITVFWFIREGAKLIECTKTEFDKAITEGKSIKYNGYPNRKVERVAEQLEASRMTLLGREELSAKFRAKLLNPQIVVQVQVIDVCDPFFWEQESKLFKYQ